MVLCDFVMFLFFFLFFLQWLLTKPHLYCLSFALLPLCSSFSPHSDLSVGSFHTVRFISTIPRLWSAGQTIRHQFIFHLPLTTSNKSSRRAAHSISSSINFTLDLMIFTYAQNVPNDTIHVDRSDVEGKFVYSRYFPGKVKVSIRHYKRKLTDPRFIRCHLVYCGIYSRSDLRVCWTAFCSQRV